MYIHENSLADNVNVKIDASIKDEATKEDIVSYWYIRLQSRNALA